MAYVCLKNDLDFIGVKCNKINGHVIECRFLNASADTLNVLFFLFFLFLYIFMSRSSRMTEQYEIEIDKGHFDTLLL